ncbi:hypothetical protein [Edaphobacter aggregans]|nr:hypothetical protein [Edaphobacter aggregans]
MQTLSTGMEAQAAGKFLAESRVAPRIYHVGFMVGAARSRWTLR